MTRISIVFHSGYGHTKVVAESVKAGAETIPGAKVLLVPVEEIDAHWADLEASDAIVFGDLNDPDSEVSQILKTRRAFRLKEEYGTEPMIWYVG